MKRSSLNIAPALYTALTGLAAHWLRAGLDINTRDRNEPNVVREEITRTLMRHSIPPPWITTSEERAFALTEQSS